MHYIIYDLEWNQPPEETAVITTPVLLEGEIVELGAVKLNEQFQPVDEFRMFVTPKFYPKMHKRIVSLTGISDKRLAQEGVTFPEMYEKFTAWCGQEYTLMTWSMSDLPILVDNLLAHGMDVSKLPECCDVQRIFSREIMRGNTRYSLDTALAILKEKGDTAHDALHDARNTAKVCDHLNLEEYIGEYTARVFAEPSGNITYETRQQLREDPSLRQFICPWCGATVTCEPWVLGVGNTLLGYGLCLQEDEFLLEVTSSHHPSGGFAAKRLLFEMSDDLWDVYMDKKEPVGV